MIALYPGTFDPITNGHVDVIRRAGQLFPQLIVAIATNRRKSTLFSVQQRHAMIAAAIADLPNVKICTFDTLLIDFALQQKASVIVRGIRVMSDFEYELQMANANRTLSPMLETIFLPPSTQTSHISSSLVREILQYGGDVSAFVPNDILPMLKQQ